MDQVERWTRHMRTLKIDPRHISSAERNRLEEASRAGVGPGDPVDINATLPCPTCGDSIGFDLVKTKTLEPRWSLAAICVECKTISVIISDGPRMDAIIGSGKSLEPETPTALDAFEPGDMILLKLWKLLMLDNEINEGMPKIDHLLVPVRRRTTTGSVPTP